MRARKVTDELRLRTWSEQIRERMDSGLTVAEYCRRIGLSQKTYYYRLNRVRESVLEAAVPQSMVPATESAPKFAELTLPVRNSDSVAVTVEIGGFRADIRNGADAETVGNVLKALASL